MLVPNIIGGILADVMVAKTFQYAANDGINQGAITSIFSMCSINTALLFWYLYQEKPALRHILSMLLMSSCIYFINGGGSGQQSEE